MIIFIRNSWKIKDCIYSDHRRMCLEQLLIHGKKKLHRINHDKRMNLIGQKNYVTVLDAALCFCELTPTSCLTRTRTTILDSMRKTTARCLRTASPRESKLRGRGLGHVTWRGFSLFCLIVEKRQGPSGYRGLGRGPNVRRQRVAGQVSVGVNALCSRGST